MPSLTFFKINPVSTHERGMEGKEPLTQLGERFESEGKIEVTRKSEESVSQMMEEPGLQLITITPGGTFRLIPQDPETLKQMQDARQWSWEVTFKDAKHYQPLKALPSKNLTAGVGFKFSTLQRREIYRIAEIDVYCLDRYKLTITF